MEIRITSVELSDLIDAVQDGRMVLAAEFSPYLWQARLGQRLAKIHRDLPRDGHVSRVVFRFEISLLQSVVRGDGLLNKLD